MKRMYQLDIAASLYVAPNSEQERQSLKSEVVNPAILEARGTYPWYMWKRAHFNRVFQREVSHQKKNRGINNELCVVNIPSDYVSNLTENGEYVIGVSCYTVYVKGIPWDFHEGSFIKKCLESGTRGRIGKAYWDCLC